ncbi:hypothetical protein P5G50_02240 [Leifsonia sp. F6_8S_P_1B]|uniref:Uncharacterized protein n=1 Tax=Leifsonia williamsii TaxID=3035919 RepID=A0ABT8K727_9MICO|nr:hypothetical protein [Leifsonia williamsii]MDN4613260.1 hypothetical protein [Leifsonia williamsii]
MKLLGRSIANAGGAAIAIASLLCMGGVAANAGEPEPDPLAAVARVAPESVSDAADVQPVTTSPEAVDATVNGTNVIVPSDPEESVRLSSGNGDASLGLPFAGVADGAVVRGDGAVSYDNNNGSSTVPIVRRDGSVQINTVIRHSGAPKRYDYAVSVPSGQSLHLAPDGSVYVAAETGVPSFYIAAPWAKDAAGNPVPTHFELAGKTLTQVVDFTAETAFPVVADPTVYSTGQASYNCVLTNGSSYS